MTEILIPNLPGCTIPLYHFTWIKEFYAKISSGQSLRKVHSHHRGFFFDWNGCYEAKFAGTFVNTAHRPMMESVKSDETQEEGAKDFVKIVMSNASRSNLLDWWRELRGPCFFCPVHRIHFCHHIFDIELANRERHVDKVIYIKPIFHSISAFLDTMQIPTIIVYEVLRWMCFLAMQMLWWNIGSTNTF